jgi:hypothetical protein
MKLWAVLMEAHLNKVVVETTPGIKRGWNAAPWESQEPCRSPLPRPAFSLSAFHTVTVWHPSHTCHEVKDRGQGIHISIWNFLRTIMGQVRLRHRSGSERSEASPYQNQAKTQTEKQKISFPVPILRWSFRKCSSHICYTHAPIVGD